MEERVITREHLEGILRLNEEDLEKNIRLTEHLEHLKALYNDTEKGQEIRYFLTRSKGMRRLLKEDIEGIKELLDLGIKEITI